MNKSKMICDQMFLFHPRTKKYIKIVNNLPILLDKFEEATDYSDETNLLAIREIIHTNCLLGKTKQDELKIVGFLETFNKQFFIKKIKELTTDLFISTKTHEQWSEWVNQINKKCDILIELIEISKINE